MPDIAPLPQRSVIRIEGDDWPTFLRGLCTAPIDVDTPFVTHGAFLRPQGKIICDVMLIPQADGSVLLDVPSDQRAELTSKLNMYKLRAKVAISTPDLGVFASINHVPEDLPEGFATDPRSVFARVEIGRGYGQFEATATPEDWKVFRMGLGLAEAGTDFGPDALYAIDANLDALGGIDFKKGCYVGQELTSRMKRRGQIKNRIVPLTHLGELSVGAELWQGDRKMGEVLSSVEGRSLALVRLDRLSEGDMRAGDTTVTLSPPDWLKPYMVTPDV